MLSKPAAISVSDKSPEPNGLLEATARLRLIGRRRELTLVQLLGRQAAAEVPQGLRLHVAGRSGNDMAEQAADDVRLVRLEFERVREAAGDGGESVAVEIAERSEPMGNPAQVRRFIEEHPPPMVLLPNFASAVVAVARGFMKRVLGLAQGGVRGGHDLPVEQFKPRSFHAAA